MRKILIFGFMFLLGFMLFQRGVFADANISACGTLNTASEDYYLINNVSTAGNCFTIDANNLTLDCQGNSISGDGTGNGIYFNSGVHDFTLEDCIIDHFDENINSELSNSNMSFVNVSSNRATQSSFRFLGASNVYVKDSSAKDDADGLLIFGVNSYNLTVDNFTAVNGTGCISTWDNASFITITNVVCDISYWNGFSFDVTGFLNATDISCSRYGTSGSGSCVWISNSHDIIISGMDANRKNGLQGHGIAVFNSYNLVTRDSIVNGTGLQTGRIGFRYQACDNCNMSNVSANNIQRAVWIWNSTNDDLGYIHAGTNTMGIGIRYDSQNITLHDSLSEGTRGLLIAEGAIPMQNIHVYNNNFSNAVDGLHMTAGLGNSYFHDNYFSGESYFSGTNLTFTNNSFGKYLLSSYSDAFVLGFNNDIGISNMAGGLPIYYYENRTSDITGLNTHDIICLGCKDMEIKDMDLGGTSAISFMLADNLTIRNITVNNTHSVCVGANATIINSRFSGTLPLDCYWDYGQPFTHMIMIDSVIDGTTGVNGLLMLNTNASLINTTVTELDYGDNNSFVSRYWYADLSYNSPLAPEITVRDNKSNIVFVGTSGTPRIIALEYVGSCSSPDCYSTSETRDYFTPYTYETSAENCNKISSGGFGLTGNINSLISLDYYRNCAFMTDIGRGTGAFLGAVSSPLAYIILILGIISGVLTIFFVIAGLVKGSLG